LPYRLILIAEGGAPFGEAAIVRLNEVANIDPLSRRFVPLADPCTLVDAPRERKGGAPNLYRDHLTRLIQTRMDNGDALDGTNAEAKAVQKQYPELHPNAQVPSLSTIKRYVAAARGGS